MDVAASSEGPRVVTTSVDHPKLTKTDCGSIRTFLWKYDQYAREVAERAQQILGDRSISTEVSKPVQLKFCVNPEWLESVIDLGFIPNTTSYASLSNDALRVYLEEKAVASKDVVTIESLDKLVESHLRIDMSDMDARSRIENLFISYKSLLRRHGLAWLTEDNEKLSVCHVLAAIRPASLRNRLESDLELSHYHLRKDFKGFMAHTIKLSEAFQLVDCGPPSRSQNQNKKNRGSGIPDRHYGNNEGSNSGSQERRDKNELHKKKLPICLWAPHKEKGFRHFLKDCTGCPEQEKRELLDRLAAEKAVTGPSKGTRSQTRLRESSVEQESKALGRISASKENQESSFKVTLSDGNESVMVSGRADDGADDSIISGAIAEKAVLNGIGKIKKISPVTMQVALKEGAEAEKFTFSRTWIIPRTVLKLSAGPLALLNLEYLVSDCDLAAEDLLLGLPVLRHLGVDTKTLLEERRDLLDGSDCANISTSSNLKKTGHVSRLMIARLSNVVDRSPKSGNVTGYSSDDGCSYFATRENSVNYFHVREEVDPFPDPSIIDLVDIEQKQDIHLDLSDMLKKVDQKDVSKQYQAELSKLVMDNINLFRTSFSSGPPAKVAPLVIKLSDDAKPMRVRLRNYSMEQREFLSRFVTRLVDAGMAYSNPAASWACAPLLVPKEGPSMFRFTVDLRPVNRFTVKHQYPMPNIEQELCKLSSSRFFATFDLSHGYWQLPLSECSQECQSFITPDGIYTPTRVLHGTTNAVMHLQATLGSLVPESLRPVILWWLDDILIHTPSVPAHIKAIKEFFTFCAKFNFKLHPAKCTVLSSTIRWCGRIISAGGVRFDPRRIEGIQTMNAPQTGADLQQFVCAMRWMRSGIPEFSNVISPLSDLLEKVYEMVGKRTRAAAGRIALSAAGWGSDHETAFKKCKQVLAHQATLAHIDHNKRLCVYTDASDYFWSGVVTQIPISDCNLPCLEQRHEPLAFLSGHFSDSSLRWATIEKEAYAIMATTERMHWLLASARGFDLYTDHNNLIFLFNPTSVVADLSQTSIRKVLRWAVRLSVYNYTCIHVSGSDNVWADLISRWRPPHVLRRLVKVPALSSSGADSFEWPSITSLQTSQEKNITHASSKLQRNEDGLLCNENGAIWIPDQDADLQLRLCVIAHTGPSGHRSASTTSKILCQHYTWSTITEDVRTFVAACIHCLSTMGGGKVPRPYGPAVHGTAPNDLLQFDYIEMSKAVSGEKYILMLRDDHSNYCWLFAFPDTSAENAARAIIDWSAAFGVPTGLMSDGPTHFKNETVRLVTKGLRVPHHFTLPYSPWSNGGIERLGKELLRTFRAVTSELQLAHNEWPDLLPVVQSALNNSPSPHRADVPPIKAMTGLSPTPPVATFYRSTTAKPVTIAEVLKLRSINCKMLADLVGQLQPLVKDSLQSNRQRTRESMSKGKLPNFTEGDFVLVARDEFHKGEKLCLRWRGPRRIVKPLNNFVYRVKDLRNGSHDDVHVSRLKFYHDASLDKEEILPHVVSSETGMIVHRLMELIKVDNKIMVHVRWRGLSESEDTFEPLEQIYEDVPELLLKLLKRKNSPADLVDEARRQLQL